MAKNLNRVVISAVLSMVTTQAVAGNRALEFFEDEAQVTTASRRPEPERLAPVTVEVITSEQIQASGATNLWDLMRYSPGMDVSDGRSIDGNRAVVSVRGFPQEFVANLQVLLDGRSVYSRLSGGVFWEQLPVQIQDIERIEIVRGPNAALYGSNAGLGVINIITKKPDGQEFSGYGFGGSRGTAGGGAVAQDALGPVRFRMSYSYFSTDGFPTVPHPSVPVRDDLLTHKASLRGDWANQSGTEAQFFAGGSWESSGMLNDNEGRFREAFGMLKLSQSFNSNSALEAFVSRSRSYYTYTPDYLGLTTLSVQDDLEAFHRYQWWDERLVTTWGGNVRIVENTSPSLFAGEPVQTDRLVRGFIQQSIHAREELSFHLAVSLENARREGTQPAYQAAIVFTPSPIDVVRLSYAMAPSLPNLVDTDGNYQQSPQITVVGNPGLGAQKLQSFELAFQRQFLARRLEGDLNVYYMLADHLVTAFPGAIVFFPAFHESILFQERNNAIARGIEAKALYRIGPGRSVYVNYTFERITDEAGDVTVTDGTPRHKLNLGGIANLGYGFSLSANAGFKSRYTASLVSLPETASIGSYWRLDTRLAYRPRSNVEMFVVGQNLAQARHAEFADGLEAPRSVFAGVQLTF